MLTWVWAPPPPPAATISYPERCSTAPPRPAPSLQHVCAVRRIPASAALVARAVRAAEAASSRIGGKAGHPLSPYTTCLRRRRTPPQQFYNMSASLGVCARTRSEPSGEAGVRGCGGGGGGLLSASVRGRYLVDRLHDAYPPHQGENGKPTDLIVNLFEATVDRRLAPLPTASWSLRVGIA